MWCRRLEFDYNHGLLFSTASSIWCRRACLIKIINSRNPGYIWLDIRYGATLEYPGLSGVHLLRISIWHFCSSNGYPVDICGPPGFLTPFFSKMIFSRFSLVLLPLYWVITVSEFNFVGFSAMSNFSISLMFSPSSFLVISWLSFCIDNYVFLSFLLEDLKLVLFF